MSNEGFSHWYSQLQQYAVRSRLRSLIVLVGEDDWLNQRLALIQESMLVREKSLKTAIKGLNFQTQFTTLKREYITSVDSKNYLQYLGTEQALVVFPLVLNTTDDYSFDVDAFAALSGSVVAGGVMVITVLKSGENDPKVSPSDLFLQRFWQLLQERHAYIVQQQEPKLPLLPEPIATQNSSLNMPENLPYGCVSNEQASAVDAMLKVMVGRRNRPLVLTADRGRGKSSAMALATCQLLINAKQKLKIIITAASRQAVNIFFFHVKQTLPSANVTANHVEHEHGEIIFLPIDLILKEQPSASLVMVDEAAALPVYLLEQLLGYYHRLIFASTVHGYEGAGRGFSLKFRATLAKVMPQWRKLHINEPIRWASNDPLETFVFSSCLLNAELPSYHENASRLLAATDVVKVSARELLLNETLLQQVFAVLVTAHYQTSPSDVQLLLNNPAVSLFLLKHEDDILAVALLLKEGQVDNTLVDLVRNGKRRLRDQFLPQSLLTHCGVNDSFTYSYQRVMRIAVHPEFQNNGLGQHFLNHIEQKLSHENVDFIGSSFAGNASLISFWQQSGFSLARIGFSKDKASGEHSCLLLKPITKRAKQKQHQIIRSFYQQFDYWLTDEFKQLPAQMVWQVLHNNICTKNIILAAEHKQAVDDFISGRRQYSSCVYGLHQWLIMHCLEEYSTDVLPLIARILQKHSIEDVCQNFSFSGKKALNQHLINTIAKYQN